MPNATRRIWRAVLPLSSLTSALSVNAFAAASSSRSTWARSTSVRRAAEGSARDAQSLLDQAISHGAGETTAVQVRAMLGLADRGRVMDLMDMILRGDTAGALGDAGSPASEQASASPQAASKARISRSGSRVSASYSMS